jgi:hypothetical protein
MRTREGNSRSWGRRRKVEPWRKRWVVSALFLMELGFIFGFVLTLTPFAPTACLKTLAT